MELLLFTSFFILAGVMTAAADDLSGSLCTCTPICTSPPSTTMQPPSPAAVTLKPPPPPDSPPATVSKPPPSPNHAPPPPRFYYFDSPEAKAPTTAESSPPPPAYISLGGPPSPRLVYFPSTPAAGENSYPYPYYMYDSKAAASSYVGILWVLTTTLLVCRHICYPVPS